MSSLVIKIVKVKGLISGLTLVSGLLFSCHDPAARSTLPEQEVKSVEMVPKRVAELRRIHYKWSPQKEILSEDRLIDNQFGLVASSSKVCSLEYDSVNTHKGHAVYKFEASAKANRIELTECFARAKDIDGISEQNLENLGHIKDVYGLVSCGEYGDTISYSWYTRFPKNLNSKSKGIFAQWHGRPDRTTIRTPNGSVEKWSVDEFLKFSEKINWKSMDDKKAGVRAFDKVTGAELAYTVDGSAGGPIGAFSVSEGNVQLLVRNDPGLISTNARPKLKVKPSTPIMEFPDGRSAELVYHESLQQLALGEWIHFRVEIKYSNYSGVINKSLSSGHVKLWIDSELKANWQGNVGKNDYLGPYFKFGIYKPGENGFKVEHCGYHRELIEKGARPKRTMLD